MKFKILCSCFLLSFVITLSGCSGCYKTTSYPFYYDESEIESISIVYTLESYNGYLGVYDYQILLEIEDIDEFLTRFKEIQFGSFQFGDPEEIKVNTNAILVRYYNGDFEIITYAASDIVVNGEQWGYGRPHCDKEEFDNFINSYLVEDS